MVIGIVGRGPWGKNVEKTLREDPRVDTVLVRGRRWQDLLDTRLSGVVVACPPEHHVDVALPFVERGTPVFVEKPLALSSAEASPLVEAAALRPSTPVLVDHVLLFSELYAPLRAHVHESLARGGTVLRCSIEWTGVRRREDVSPLWDYGSHVVALVLDLFGSSVSFVWDSSAPLADHLWFSAEGGPLVRPARLHTGIATTMATRQVTRTVLVEMSEPGRSQGFVWDDIAKRVWDLPGRTPGTPGLEPLEERTLPLTRALRVFLDAIEGKPDPRLGFDLGLTVVRRLEGLERAATR
jgi:predicted dehydrogenase